MEQLDICFIFIETHLPSFEDDYIDFCCTHGILYIVTLLNSEIFFLWFRAQIVVPDHLGSYPGSATSYSLPPCLSFPRCKWR